ncbi:TIGR03668 family PPOX class F420-dependent oxidoreductase [Embleya sp. AB8]|uniref:TIGR03668 family PPOX class F420-dependent oxidoreductase n=1 Tax=Embleya sp. AB8 TaxID=3156304 RepID=UPI003C71C863
MRLSSAEARIRFQTSRVARLATVSGGGEPHLVPITFVLTGNALYFAIDHKPKTSSNLRRLSNIRENNRVSVLVDRYADDWSELWWARADGSAEIWDDGADRARALDLLRERYPQYREQLPTGPVVAITVHTLSGWSFAA